ncbi:MAG: T9SS type A sorting domain-containing protein [Flavobacteriales bacterium]|nr:T9SS type A sorting domain-containing protein [Flavobacteriales bacterium]
MRRSLHLNMAGGVIALSALLFLTPLLRAQEVGRALPAATAQVNGTANAAQRSALLSTARAGEASIRMNTTRWANRVSRISPRNPQLPEVEAIKQAKWPAKVASFRGEAGEPVQPKAVTPAIGVNMEGNWSQVSTPPDNTMAISNGGQIVTCNNDGIELYNASGQFLASTFWPDFFNDPQLNANIYDPKVIYDPQADRFFLTVLHGTTSSNSLLLLCFSKTNNPQDGWWIYYLPGSPLGNGTWFDYPSIGVSNNEVYVSGNLFTDGNNQFQQAILFQITKSGGYNGTANLDWIYWYNLSNQPFAAFTVVPVSGGQANYGPGILLLSGNSPGANSLRLWDLTDDLTGNPSLNVYDVSTQPYAPAAPAQMPGSPDPLSNGDCRMLSTFFMNGLVHYTFCTDIGGGWNGLRYGRINISTLNDQRTNLGQQGTADLCYPALASYSTSNNDPSVMIAFTRSSAQVFPEARVVNVDANLQWSNSTLVKEGETYVNFLQQGDERWGDYTGMARRHNANPPRVWMAACYGSNIQGGLQNTWKTWVAEVGDVGSSVVPEQAPAMAVSVAPNPTVDLFRLSFHIDAFAIYTIEVLDLNGRVVKTLYQDGLTAGEHQLSFNRNALSAGQYVIAIRNGAQPIAHEPLVIH